MEVGSARKPRKPDGKKPRRAIFSIESPFQLLSSIAIIKDEERCIDYSTLVVSNRFKCAEDYVDRLREAGIFDQVILSEYSYRDPKKAPLKEALRGAIYDSRFVELSQQFSFREYDVLYFPGVNNLNLELKMSFVKNGHSELIDDGTGSHNASIAKAYSLLDPIVNYREAGFNKIDFAKWVAKCATRALKGTRYSMDIASVNLFNPSDGYKKRYKNVDVRLSPIRTVARRCKECFLSPTSASTDQGD